MPANPTDILVLSAVKPPEGPIPEDACWRCGGTGQVDVTGSFLGTGADYCGACMGTKVAPHPCPKCGAKEVKGCYDGSAFCMRCRNCGHMGPWARTDIGSYHAWQASKGEAE